MNKTLADAFAIAEKLKAMEDEIDKSVDAQAQPHEPPSTDDSSAPPVVDPVATSQVQAEQAIADALSTPAEPDDDVVANISQRVETLTKEYVGGSKVEGFTQQPNPVDQPTKTKINVKGLDEKAVLVQVKRRMYSPYKLDKEESSNYGAGNVNKHLFEGRNNRVKEAISKYTAVYTYVKNHTVPWTTGVEMLNINHYFDFTSALRELIDDANQTVDDLYTHWDYEVQQDLQRLANIASQKGKPNLANPSDYPSADEMRSRFGIEVRYMPVPTTGDFRVGISDEDKASLENQLLEAERNAATHVLTQMLEPMQSAVKKLTVPIGDDGHIFRDSLIDNMVDVAERMNKVNISDDPRIQQSINDLRSLVGTYANNKDVLRNSQSVREKAATQINDLVSKMSGLV